MTKTRYKSTETKRNPNINYDKLIFYNKFQRIQPKESVTTPVLKPFWITTIEPKQSSQVMSLVKGEFNYTSETLKHLKRFQKLKDETTNKVVLQVVICAFEDISYTDLRKKLTETLNVDLNDVVLDKLEIPMNKPLDKEVNVEWSNKYWPLVWKGNPMVQELHESFKQFDNEENMKFIKYIIQKSREIQTISSTSKQQEQQQQQQSAGLQSHKTTFPIVTAFIDPKTKTIASIHTDSRTKLDPTAHSTMKCIAEIAEKELSRRQQSGPAGDDPATNNYLCLNYHVYTTHEPCTMCAMAMLHSRISKLVYVRESKLTGGIGEESGAGYMIHLSCQLNWKFESFRYLADNDEDNVDEVDMYIDV
ncbi:unnamed protein product [Ambrosiozyma monospora]|uniref:Unnamed protein product n=1 Tax=Ambrosiozyma monospora TaxID=43982 RepID=A0A9W6YYC7_AMBMO|nr:unnamed protein product [Ambrosiozyma monospora]